MDKEQCTGGNTKDIETSCSYTQNEVSGNRNKIYLCVVLKSWILAESDEDHIAPILPKCLILN